MKDNNIQVTLPGYPIRLEPPEGVPDALMGILLGLYKTSDAGEAATLAADSDWIICDVVWGENPETWVLGKLKDRA